ncbi:MAG: hypothetical protein RL885_02995 [Planctomycetota bacterium]
MRIQHIDAAIARLFQRHAHFWHRQSLGVLFLWFGLLKPFGHDTTTSIVAHTIYWGSSEVWVQVLGWWEVTIGLCLIYRPLVRVALLLLLIRLPGILLAFAYHPQVCFEAFPFAPTPEGQYLIKDLAIFVATASIAGSVRERSTKEQRR